MPPSDACEDGGQRVSEELGNFLDNVLQRYFGLRLDDCPRMSLADLDRLLTDDTQRRLHHARLAAADWGSTEIGGSFDIAAECVLITPRGLVYAASLTGAAPQSGAPVYFLATPPELFEPIADRVGDTRPLPDWAAAVDSRFSHDLVFTWPLDRALRRTLDAHEVLRLDPMGHQHA